MRTFSLVSASFVAVLIAEPVDAQVQVPIDKNHSTIGFSVPIFGGLSQVTGKFTEFDIDMKFDGFDPASVEVTATIQVASVNTGIAQRDMHLKSRAFFDAKNHPTIIFESVSVEQTDDGYLAHGNFTMRGVTKEIDLPFNIIGINQNADTGRANVGLHAVTVLDRTDYAVNYQHDSIDNFVGNDIAIDIHLLTKSFSLSGTPNDAARKESDDEPAIRKLESAANVDARQITAP